jgi:hypothetical protein
VAEAARGRLSSVGSSSAIHLYYEILDRSILYVESEIARAGTSVETELGPKSFQTLDPQRN